MKKFKRIVLYVAVVTLLLTSLTGCDDYRERVAEVFNTLKNVLVADAEPSEPEIAEPEISEPEPAKPEVSEPEPSEEPSEPERENSENQGPTRFLIYTLSEEDIATYESQLLLCEQMLKDGVSYEDMEAAVDTLDELACGLQNQASIAEVLYYSDLQNEETEENYLFSSEVSTEITSEFLKFLVALYDNGAYAKYFEDWSELEMKYLESYSEETVELEVRNSEILAEFYDLQEEEFEEKIGVLYSEFINNCNEIATKSGYANYYDYASTLSYKRDYGAEEREQFRKYVKEYIVPLYYSVYAQYEDAYEDLSRAEWKLVEALSYGEYDSLEMDYVNAYFEALPENLQTYMVHMFEEEAYLMKDSDGSYEGAFTTYFGVPFCYFGPGYQDSFTLIHEIGHYYAECSTDTSWLSYDLCETHSQGNEMLFLNYLGTVLDPQVYEALEIGKLSTFIDTIVVAVLMDEFEETVYNLPEQVNYTAEEFDEIMHQIIRSYGFAEDDEYIIAYGDWLWRNVGINTPVYYLSYATSAMASLNIYSQGKENYDAALEMYRIIQEEVDEDRNFMGTLEKAGLDSVFEEEAFIKLQGLFEG